MTSQELKQLYSQCKESQLFGRYITNSMIVPLIKKRSHNFLVKTIGHSVEQRSIFSITLGTGKTKVLLWSQMHGNESTTTKALFDLLSVFADTDALDIILKSCTLCIIPILNPDGAERYTRLNANQVDLNRDAQDLSQAESKVLRQVFNVFQPDYCFNLHGQRTIYGAGTTGYPATLSFLSPSQDKKRAITENRKSAMAIIALIARGLKTDLPNAIGRYDDRFNINCVGDTFQSLNIPTVLFEAGHYHNDYVRERVRLYTFMSLYYGLNAVSDATDLCNYKSYFDIPENKTNFYDVIIRNARLNEITSISVDIAIQFEEILDTNTIVFKPFVKKIESLNQYFAHKQIDAKNNVVLNKNRKMLKVGSEIDFVLIKNEKILIKL